MQNTPRRLSKTNNLIVQGILFYHEFLNTYIESFSSRIDYLVYNTGFNHLGKDFIGENIVKGRKRRK